MSLTTVNGPAPTGYCANCFALSLLTAVGDAIQLVIASNIWLMNAPSGWFSLTTTVDASGVVITPALGGEPGAFGFTRSTGHCGAQVQVALRSRVKFQATAAALNGVPSLNWTPWRSLIVTVLPSGEMMPLVARSLMIFPFAPSSKS